jgi:hypothetical protein
MGPGSSGKGVSGDGADGAKSLADSLSHELMESAANPGIGKTAGVIGKTAAIGKVTAVSVTVGQEAGIKNWPPDVSFNSPGADRIAGPGLQAGDPAMTASQSLTNRITDSLHSAGLHGIADAGTTGGANAILDKLGDMFAHMADPFGLFGMLFKFLEVILNPATYAEFLDQVGQAAEAAAQASLDPLKKAGGAAASSSVPKT